MNAYEVKFVYSEFYDSDERGAMYIDHDVHVTVMARSRGLVRVFIMEVFDIDEFTYPMSIKIIDKDVPVEDGDAQFPEEYGYEYEFYENEWHRTALETMEVKG